MIYNLKFTAHAYRDIQSIYEYISKNLYAPMSANRIMKMIQDSIENLKSFPYSAPAVKDDFLSRKGFRKLITEDYIVLYKVDENNKSVIIHRIVNGKTDYKNLFHN